MPGSLSNEDEGQDDVDFGDDLPGEVKGRRGVLQRLAPLRLECGQKGSSCVSESTEEEKEGGVQKAESCHYSLFIFAAPPRLGGGDALPGLAVLAEPRSGASAPLQAAFLPLWLLGGLS